MLLEKEKLTRKIEPKSVLKVFPLGVFLIILFIALRTISQILLKFIAVSDKWGRYPDLFRNPLFYCACMLYLLQTIVWMTVLKRFPLSSVYPYTSLTVITIMVSGSVFFSEFITLGNVLGALVIICGLIVITGAKTIDDSVHEWE